MERKKRPKTFNYKRYETVFDTDLDPKRIIKELGIFIGKAITPETLIVFNEIQFCNKALTSLKYFCEEVSEYHVACAGSLIEITLSRPLSFPVGKIDFFTLYPMNFKEFLLAQNEELLINYLIIQMVRYQTYLLINLKLTLKNII